MASIMRSLLLLCVTGLSIRQVTSAALDLYPRAADACADIDLTKSKPPVNQTLLDNGDKGDNGTDDTLEWEDGTASAQSSKRRRSVTQTQWQANVAKGRQLWLRLQNHLADLSAQDKPETCDLSSRWDILSPDGLDWIRFDGLGLSKRTDVLPAEILSFPQPNPTFLSWVLMADDEETERDEDEVGDYVVDMDISPEYGLIDVRHIITTRTLQDGRIGKAPDRWSDVTWRLWRTVCDEARKPTSSLKYIIRDNIVNPITRDVINYVTANLVGAATVSEFVDQATVTPSSNGILGETFFAMLQTPNVIGVIYFLMDYAVGLGRKTIKSIGLQHINPHDQSKSQEYYAWIELEDYDPRPAAGPVGTS